MNLVLKNAFELLLKMVTEASKSHTFLLASGGYVMAENSEGKVLRTADGISRVISVSSIGQKSVVKIKLSNAHAYLTNGIWSLE